MEWISVEDKTPAFPREVLVFYKDSTGMTGFTNATYYNGKWEKPKPEGNEMSLVTHWAIVDPPKE